MKERQKKANMSMEVTVRQELRPCVVSKGSDERKALFHEWEEISRPYVAVQWGDPTGMVVSKVAIVEYEDGAVDEVYPSAIKFLDNAFRGYDFGIAEVECR